MKRALSRNYIFNLGYQIIIIIIPVITMPYVSRVLGPDAVGTQSYTYSIVSYFLLLGALGTTTYAQREIAICQDDSMLRSRVFWEILILRIAFSSISIIIYMFFCFWVFDSSYSSIYLVQVIYLVSCILDITWYFQGMEDFKTVVLLNIFFRLGNLLYIFTYIKSSKDIVPYVFGLAVFPMLANISMWFHLRQHLIKIDIESLHPFRHFSGTVSLFIPTIASQIYLVTDKTMLGMLTQTKEENGFFEQAEKIVRIALTLYSSYGTVVVPRVASLYAQKRFEEIQELILHSFRLMWLITSLLFWGLISVADNFIPWYLGVSFSKVSSLLIIFSWLVIVVGISNVLAVQFLVPIRKHNVFTISVISGAIVNLMLNILLIPKYFSMGAAIASICAESLITSIQMYYVFRMMKFIKISDAFKFGLRYFLTGGVMALYLINIKPYVGVSFLGTFFLAVNGIIIYSLVLFMIKDKLILDISHKIIYSLSYYTRRPKF